MYTTHSHTLPLHSVFYAHTTLKAHMLIFYGDPGENPRSICQPKFANLAMFHVSFIPFTYGVRGARTSDPNLWNHSGERRRVSGVRHPCYP
jgi:hypothetical protein